MEIKLNSFTRDNDGHFVLCLHKYFLTLYRITLLLYIMLNILYMLSQVMQTCATCHDSSHCMFKKNWWCLARQYSNVKIIILHSLYHIYHYY